MPALVYRLVNFLYRFTVAAISPFHTKAKLVYKGRKRLLDQIETELQDNQSPIVWFHCASLGEFEQGRPIIEEFKREHPSIKVLLTFFSPSGYEVRKEYAQADYVFYLPWDSKKNAQRFIDLVNPQLVLFVKYEFWYYYFRELSKRNITLLSVSSIFRPNQIYFKPYGKFYLGILKMVDHFFVQNRASKLLLESHGLTNVSIAGDTRFDRVSHIVTNKKSFPLVEKFKGNSKVMVIGSSWPEDMNILMSFVNNSDLKFIIAPHEINGKCQDIIVRDSVKKTILYSQLEEARGDEQILIIDNIGMLSSLYAYGEYAYVGGAFGAGLHNILEAATYGIPIFFGNKNYKKFNEAVELINLGGAVAIGDETELRQQFDVFSQDQTMAIAGQVNKDYVEDNTGATSKIMAYCNKILEP